MHCPEISYQFSPFFERRFPIYGEAIRKKCNEKDACNFQQGQFFVGGFIDCNNTTIAKPDAGPDRPDPKDQDDQVLLLVGFRKDQVLHLVSLSRVVTVDETTYGRLALLKVKSIFLIALFTDCFCIHWKPGLKKS